MKFIFAILFMVVGVLSFTGSTTGSDLAQTEKSTFNDFDHSTDVVFSVSSESSFLVSEAPFLDYGCIPELEIETINLSGLTSFFASGPELITEKQNRHNQINFWAIYSRNLGAFTYSDFKDISKGVYKT